MTQRWVYLLIEICEKLTIQLKHPLKADGWKVGSAEDFLQLNDEAARLVALKLTLISAVKKTHQTQTLAN